MDSPQEEYLTVAELSERIKFSKQTIYNLISQKVFEINKHFIKPRPKKILFIWAEVKAWMEGSSESHNTSHESAPRSGVTGKEVIQAAAKLNIPESAIKI